MARELRQSEERLQSVLDSSYAAYVALDESGCVTDWNRQAVAIFGYSRDEALGKPIAELIIPPRYRAAHWQGLHRFLATGEGPVFNQRLEQEALHRDGHEFPVAMTIWPLRVGSHWSFHALLLDATEIHESRRKALAAERQAAVGQVITLLTQECRNPLQRIQMWSEMLALELKKSPTSVRAIAEIQKAQARLEQILIDVRGYAAPLRLARRTVNLSELWREAWRQLTQLHGGQLGHLREDLDDVDVRCQADAQAMQQVFFHVFDNAVSRIEQGPQIQIACREEKLGGNSAVCVLIRDNGSPYCSEDWRQLDLGQSKSPATALESERTRLSMAIVARIVDAHGGRLIAGGSDWPGGELRIILDRGA
jgi:PAS domain S-box-containing protein